MLDFLALNDEHDPREIRELNFAGPQVTLSMVTTSGKVFTKKVSSLDFHFEQHYVPGRREVCWVLNTLPLKLADSKDMGNSFPCDNCTDRTGRDTKEGWFWPIIQTLLSEDAFHLAMRVSADVVDNSNLSFLLEVESPGQSLNFEVDNTGIDKFASWGIEGSLGGKGSIIQQIIKALSTLNKFSQIYPPTPLQEKLGFLLEYFKFIADYTSPWRDWEGVQVAVLGTASLSEMTLETWSIHAENRIELHAPYSHWAFGATAISEYLHGKGPCDSFAQEFIIDNPSENIMLIAEWIQGNALKPLADYLNTPSLVYYGTYFSKYFKEALTVFLMDAGEPQENGTLLIRFARDEAGKIWIGGCELTDFGNLLLDYIKSKLGIWW